MWKDVGGDKLENKNKIVEKKQVHVEITNQHPKNNLHNKESNLQVA